MPGGLQPCLMPGSFVRMLIIILDLFLGGFSQPFTELLVNASEHF